MIATLNGILKVKKNNFVIIEVNGVGYELLVSKKTINNLGQLNQPVSFLTDLQIKDDKILLYGFKNYHELNMFKLLQSIQGIGPRAALSILSTLMVEEIILAIKSTDKQTIQKSEGIGPRVATRIITELQEKINEFSLTNDFLESNQDNSLVSFFPSGDNSIFEDSVSAIVNLGYSRSDAYKAVNLIKDEFKNSKNDDKISVEKIVPLALKKLSS